MNIGKIRTGGVYQPGGVPGGETAGTPGNEVNAGRETLSVGLARVNPLEEAPVTSEVEADLRRDDDIGQLFKAAYGYRPPALKTVIEEK